MTATQQPLANRVSTRVTAHPSRDGNPHGQAQAPAESRILSLWRRLGPYLVTSALLLLGYLHYAPGAHYSLSAEHYRAWAFPAFRYSDLIWLYLRDGLETRPLPYVDYPLEYPPLTGLLSWLISFAPDPPAYFTVAYLVLASAALLTVWALRHLDGANAWLFAASPALFFYTGHQWDMAAISVAALALVALQRQRTGWGVTGLVVATSLKLFPVVFVAGAVVERIRDHRYRSAAAIALGFVAGTLAINVPVAMASLEGWSFFFRWNRDRLADSGIWVLWRGAATDDLTRWSLVAAAAGGVALTLLACRTRGPLLVPLGSTYLLWWLLVNKTFTTHLILWVILSIALLGAPLWLWLLTTAIDLVGFQLGNYLNLYNINDFRHAPLIRKAVENIYDPVQIARSAVLLVCAFWGVQVMRAARGERATRASPLRVAQDEQCIVDGTTPLRRYLSSPSFRLPTFQWSLATLAETATRSREVVGWFGATLVFAAATVFMTWPYAIRLRDATVVGFDPYLQIWLSEWIQHAARSNPRGLFDANIFYPFAQTLAYTDANVPGALIAAPLRILTGDPILTNSLLVLATFVLAATGVYALVHYLTGNRGAALIAGFAYAFLPYRMVHLWHLNWLEGAWLPWLLLALLRLIDRPTLGRAVALGLLTATLLLTSFYFSVQIALLCGVVVAARFISVRSWPSVAFSRSILLSLLIVVTLALPLYVPYMQVREEQRLERTIDDAEQYKALPGSYLQLAPWDTPNAAQRLLGVCAGANESLTEVGQAQHADGHQHAEIVIEDALFPGFVAILFALVALVSWRERRWLTIAFLVVGLIAVLLSLGPTLGPRHGDGFPLPYGWLFEHVPLVRSMRVTARLGGLTALMIVLLAGLGLAAAWIRVREAPRFIAFAHRPWAGSLLTAALSAAVLAELWTGTIPLESVAPRSDFAAANWLTTQPDAPVMEFPAESVFADPAAASVRRHYGETMFASTLHWKPLVNGNSGFIPRGYSDFIERFVGEIARPDGTITSRISHVNGETARLLQQIGIRYLVFHRAQYQDNDWPAVAAQLDKLVESGVLSFAGEYGDEAVYVLGPAIPPIASPALGLFAPTLITPESGWAPWVAVESTSGTPAVLALTRPSLLETTWYDADGRRLWREERRLPLPVVLDEPRLLCDATECLTARPFADLSRLPPPKSSGSWHPVEPGHYVVSLRLTGAVPLACRVDLDIVKDADEVWARSRDQPYRWAECVAGSHYPVNDPGALPFALSPPSVTLIDDMAALDIAMTTRQDEEVRGWFTLAPPGSSEPWNEAVYQSPILQKLVPSDEPTAFEWHVPLGTEVEPGIYGLTVWFHRRGPDGWEHAIGGDIELAPIVIDEDRTVRWAGPIRVRLATAAPPLQPGRSSRFNLDVDGTSERLYCTATWTLLSETGFAASGNAGECDRPEVAVPANVVPGRYRLHIEAHAVHEAQFRLSDVVSIPVTVIELANARGPR